MRKRGGIAFLGNHVVTLVITILCVIILLSLGNKGYAAWTGSSDRAKAERTLDQLIDQIEILPEGESSVYTLLAPTDWFLVFYDLEVVRADSTKHMPKTCADQSCLCICPGGFLAELDRSFSSNRPPVRGDWPMTFYFNEGSLDGLNLCESQGVCRVINDVSLSQTLYYSVYTGLGLSGMTSSINWISFRGKYGSGNEISLSREGVVSISEVTEHE